MLETATENVDGRAVVLRSLTGKIRPGTMITIQTTSGAVCGYGDAPAGLTYRMYLHSAEPYLFVPLSVEAQRRLRELGLIPGTWR